MDLDRLMWSFYVDTAFTLRGDATNTKMLVLVLKYYLSSSITVTCAVDPVISTSTSSSSIK